MKFKYIKTEVQGGANAILNEQNEPVVRYTANVKAEFITEIEGVNVPDNYKFYIRTAPMFEVKTDSVTEALTQIDVLGLQWLKDTFGEANVITE